MVDPKDMAEIFSLLEHPAYITQEAPGMPWQGISQNGDYQEYETAIMNNCLHGTHGLISDSEFPNSSTLC